MKLFRTDPLTEREKAYLRRVNGIVKPHSAAIGPAPASKPSDDPKFVAPYTIKARRKRRGFNGSMLSPDLRAIVEAKRAANEAFHRDLRASLARS